MVQSIKHGYKVWLIASVAVLVGSLVLLAIAVTAAFMAFADKDTPLWVIVVGILGLLGVAAGFAGMLLILGTAAWLSFREERRVKVLPPEDKVA